MEEVYENEVFMTIDEFPEYMVSDLGRVWSDKRNIYLKCRENNDGYLEVNLTNGS